MTPSWAGRAVNRRRSNDLNRLSGYTRVQVRTFLRPVTFSLVLLFGVGPAATIACGLTCSSPAAHSDHHGAATHQHQPAVAENAPSPDAVLLLSTRASNCEHGVMGRPALTSSPVKVFAPIALDLLAAPDPDPRHTRIAVVARSTAGPPGIRSGPLSLRI